jgi:NAD(P)H dehydrogenase (quinone)
MSIVVTAAAGHLGHLVVEALLARGVPAGDIVAGARNADRLADLGDQGVRVVHLDYDDPASLDAAFADADADVVVFVSSNDFANRVAQHHRVIDAAVRAGVGRVVYTSGPKADTSPMLLMTDHRLTEQAIRESGLPFTFLRNGWYTENYSQRLPEYVERGIVGAAGDGLVSLAPRADYADAAAVVAIGDEHAGAVYELGGEAVTMTDVAEIISQVTGAAVTYTDLTPEALEAGMVEAGLPAELARVFADVDARIAEGYLEVTSGDLERLIGRPTTPVRPTFALAAGS